MDILSDIILRVLKEAGAQLTEAARIEMQIRREYGGERYYVGKDLPSEKKTESIAAGLAAGLPLRTVFENAGVGYRHGLRLVHRRRR